AGGGGVPHRSGGGACRGLPGVLPVTQALQGRCGVRPSLGAGGASGKSLVRAAAAGALRSRPRDRPAGMRRFGMTRRTALLSIAAAALRAQPAHKIQVVILTGRDDHDWRGATPLMRQYLDAAGIFETRIDEECRDIGLESLKRYDVAVLV